MVYKNKKAIHKACGLIRKDAINKSMTNKDGMRSRTGRLGFTIVELLVVIVVIGILATITVISYTGVTNKATVASLTSDLGNAAKQLKLYYVDHGVYPASLNADSCPLDSSGVVDNRYCIKISSGNTYNAYRSSDATNNPVFCLVVNSGDKEYYVTGSSNPANGKCVNSCLDILNSGNSTGDGLYWINPAGVSLQVTCDMTNDGGGWTLALTTNTTMTPTSLVANNTIANVPSSMVRFKASDVSAGICQYKWANHTLKYQFDHINWGYTSLATTTVLSASVLGPYANSRGDCRWKAGDFSVSTNYNGAEDTCMMLSADSRSTDGEADFLFGFGAIETTPSFNGNSGTEASTIWVK